MAGPGHARPPAKNSPTRWATAPVRVSPASDPPSATTIALDIRGLGPRVAVLAVHAMGIASVRHPQAAIATQFKAVVDQVAREVGRGGRQNAVLFANPRGGAQMEDLPLEAGVFVFGHRKAFAGLRRSGLFETLERMAPGGEAAASGGCRGENRSPGWTDAPRAIVLCGLQEK